MKTVGYQFLLVGLHIQSMCHCFSWPLSQGWANAASSCQFSSELAETGLPGLAWLIVEGATQVTSAQMDAM